MAAPQPAASTGARKASWMQALSWLILLAALHQVFVFLSVTLASRDVDLWFFFSSDTVQYGLLYKDLFELGFHYAGWNISHAPEYLQMVWALLLRALTPSLAAGHVLEAMLQPLLLAAALHRLFSRALGRATSLAPLTVALILTLIARGIGLDLIGFIWSNRHGFTALIGVLALSYVLEDTSSKHRSLVLLGCLVSLGVASDLLFVVWFVVPAIPAIVIGHGPFGRAPAVKASAAIVSGTALGLLLFWIATPVITVGDKVVIDLGRTMGALGRMADDASAPSIPQLILNALVLSGFLISALSIFRTRRIEIRILGFYGIFLPLATICAMALTSVPFREAGYTRYLLGPELAAVAAVLMGLSAAFTRFGEKPALIILAISLLWGYKARPDDVAPASSFDPPLARCVDAVARKHGLQYGIADYWLAKYLTAFSSQDLSIVPVTPRLDPYVSFANIEWFLGGVGARRHDRPVYTFAILGSQTPDGPGVSPDALKAFGPPVAVESCFGFSIQVLPAGSDRRIRAQFAQNPRVRAYYARRGLSLPLP
ncbi:MAG: hypothetical protein JJE39_11540 [Vicinamibacteria bacterium]|nr:hypothetical protein [Vicinamibacteria bacterium]